jgi:glycosyltransferase involved in cell wall biosynthesis
MKVLWVTNMWPDHHRPWYGSFVFSQAQSLRALGVEIDVVYIAGYASRSEYLRSIARIRKAVAASRYDVVHAHYGHSAVLARIQTRSPLVISYCGDDLLGTPAATGGGRLTASSRLLAAAFAQWSRLAAVTITKSEQMAMRLPSRVRRRNRVIPNGVDLTRFKPGDRKAARHALGWSNQRPNVLFAGNPTIPRKNFQLAKSVCAELARRGCEPALRVAWEVPPDQVPLWLDAADLLLFTSVSEGSPNVIKEAMAAGLPIVSPPVGDVPERLSGVAGGFVVDYDVEAMADAVLAGLKVGRSFALRDAVLPLGLEQVAHQVVRVYEEVVG